MSLRWPSILPSWQYGDPSSTVLFSSQLTLRLVTAPANDPPPHTGKRDRYYTMARRFHVKRLTRGKR